MHNDEPKVQIRRDKQSTWLQRDPILLEGEIGYDLTTMQIKIGNGINSWSNLPYFNTIAPVENHILFNGLPLLP